MSTSMPKELGARPFPPLSPTGSTPHPVQRTVFENGVEAELQALAERRCMPREDHELLAACAIALRDALNVPKGQIVTAVTNGTVVLDGHTAYYYQRAAAECAVRFLDGVRCVENHITVVAPGPAHDVRDLIVQAQPRHTARFLNIFLPEPTMPTKAPNIRRATDILNSFEPTVAPSGPILVATDTSPSSDAAFPMALLLAPLLNAPVQVVSALRSNTMPMYGFDTVPYTMAADPSLIEGRQSMIERQMARTVPSATSWPVRVRVGEPLHEIVEDACSVEARVIVIGRGRHTALGRTFGGESVLRLLQLGDTPVLAVEPGVDAVPKNVVIATDFSVFSLYAAQVAVTMIAPGATVRLVHVGLDIGDADARHKAYAEGYKKEAAKGFALLTEHLEPHGFALEIVALHGNPSDRLVEYLDAINADLVVTATHGYGFLRRMVLGSVTAELVRSAPCSVLCVPGRARTIAAARANANATPQTRSYAVDVLDAELNAFTTRNAGRACSIEMDRDDLGAQSLGHGMPLVGATYDKHDRSIALMFGASSLQGEHLTHRLLDCRSVHTISNTDGRDQVMRVVHEGGQTLLLLE